MHLIHHQAGQRFRRNRLRVGRGASAGQGKDLRRGVQRPACPQGRPPQGQVSKGGQMPLQRRLPKVGFRSALKATRAEVRLHELALVKTPIIDLLRIKRPS